MAKARIRTLLIAAAVLAMVGGGVWSMQWIVMWPTPGAVNDNFFVSRGSDGRLVAKTIPDASAIAQVSASVGQVIDKDAWIPRTRTEHYFRAYDVAGHTLTDAVLEEARTLSIARLESLTGRPPSSLRAELAKWKVDWSAIWWVWGRRAAQTLWVISGVIAAVAFFVMIRLARARDETVCQWCGYSRAGIEGSVCPECGKNPADTTALEAAHDAAVARAQENADATGANRAP